MLCRPGSVPHGERRPVGPVPERQPHPGGPEANRAVFLRPVRRPARPRPDRATGRRLVSRWTRFVVALALVAAGCTSHHAHATGPSSVESPVPRGGTLRIVAPAFPASAFQHGSGLDPQKAYFS